MNYSYSSIFTSDEVAGLHQQVKSLQKKVSLTGVPVGAEAAVLAALASSGTDTLFYRA